MATHPEAHSLRKKYLADVRARLRPIYELPVDSPPDRPHSTNDMTEDDKKHTSLQLDLIFTILGRFHFVIRDWKVGIIPRNFTLKIGDDTIECKYYLYLHDTTNVYFQTSKFEMVHPEGIKDKLKLTHDHGFIKQMDDFIKYLDASKFDFYNFRFDGDVTTLDVNNYLRQTQPNSYQISSHGNDPRNMFPHMAFNFAKTNSYLKIVPPVKHVVGTKTFIAIVDSRQNLCKFMFTRGMFPERYFVHVVHRMSRICDTIVPFDNLGQIPTAALRCNEDGGDYMCKHKDGTCLRNMGSIIKGTSKVNIMKMKYIVGVVDWAKINVIDSILTQVAIALVMFDHFRFVHNDMAHRNVLITHEGSSNRAVDIGMWQCKNLLAHTLYKAHIIDYDKACWFDRVNENYDENQFSVPVYTYNYDWAIFLLNFERRHRTLSTLSTLFENIPVKHSSKVQFNIVRKFMNRILSPIEYLYYTSQLTYTPGTNLGWTKCVDAHSRPFLDVYYKDKKKVEYTRINETVIYRRIVDLNGRDVKVDILTFIFPDTYYIEEDGSLVQIGYSDGFPDTNNCCLTETDKPGMFKLVPIRDFPCTHHTITPDDNEIHKIMVDISAEQSKSSNQLGSGSHFGSDLPVSDDDNRPDSNQSNLFDIDESLYSNQFNLLDIDESW